MRSKTFISGAQTVHVVKLTVQWLITYSGRCSAGTSHSVIVDDSGEWLSFEDFCPAEFTEAT